MKILHTSDWHLGHTLHMRARRAEFESFLGWLGDLLEAGGIDAVIVAGDVFDTVTPGVRAQEMYYRFLRRAAASPCRHMVVLGGNHDSAAFLDAPAELLRVLDIHVRGNISPDPEDDVITLRDENGRPELIVCAVPFLRDRDMRLAEPGESQDDKELKLAAGMRAHYSRLGEIALQRRAQCGRWVPIVGTGHLFASGGSAGESERGLYVGCLGQVGEDIFPACLDYLALGHLHAPQTVGGCEFRRYSGSPLPMSFAEAGQRKSLCLVSLEEGARQVELVPVPCFQRMERLAGDMAYLDSALSGLADERRGESVWLEIMHDSGEVVPGLRSRLESLVAGTGMEILHVRRRLPDNLSARAASAGESLGDLGVEDVFARLLKARDVPAEQHAGLMASLRDIIVMLESGNEN